MGRGASPNRETGAQLCSCPLSCQSVSAPPAAYQRTRGARRSCAGGGDNRGAGLGTAASVARQRRGAAGRGKKRNRCRPNSTHGRASRSPPTLLERLALASASPGFADIKMSASGIQSRPCIVNTSVANGTSLGTWLGTARSSDGQEHDLPLVRQGRRGCGPLLRRDLSRQRRAAPSTVRPATTHPARRATC